MKSFSAFVVAAMAASASAFAPTSTKSTGTALKAEERLWNSMVDKTQRSKAVPYLPRPINLDGTLPGDQGFDPFYLSSIPKNFAGFIQPPSWEETKGIPTLYWMREAEVKHGRMAMLAVVGWIVADSIRLPFPQYSFDAIPNSYNAHNILVEQGTMVVFLHLMGLIEVCNGAALVQVSKGESDREAGDFGFDGGYLKGKSEAQIFKLKTQETNNGRLAMLAFGGIATQTALGHEAFPYI